MHQSKHFFYICLLLLNFFSNQADCQLFLGSSNYSGTYYDPVSIVLIPGFSTAPGQTFQAIVSSGSAPLGISATGTKNYVVTFTPRTKILDNPGNFTNSNVQVMANVQYMDGLGRPEQTVMVKASPTSRDIVQNFAYDSYNREVSKYLPYTVLPSSVSDGSFKISSMSDLFSFYSNPGNAVTWNAPGVVSTAFPSADVSFEASILNRVTEQGSEGDNWQLSNKAQASSPGHTVKISYATNDATSLTTGSGYWAKRFGVNIDANNLRTLVDEGSYAVNQLFVTITKNENWISGSGKNNTVEEYKDKDGKLILKRSYSAGLVYSTYYVYDIFQNLCYILPPKVDADTQAVSSAALTGLVFQYAYDLENRLVEKRLPGKAVESFVYNALDQIVLSQTGSLAAQGKWLFTKYDAFGKVIQTGLMNSNASRADNQSAVSNQAGPLWEVRTSNPNGFGYTESAFPFQANISQFYTINFYDDYTVPGIPSNYSDAAANQFTRGLLTVSKTNVNGTANMLWMVNYYDNLGRMTKKFKQNYIGGVYSVLNFDDIGIDYNFNNQQTNILKIHKINNVEKLRFENAIEFDHMGRKTLVKQRINNAAQWTVISKLTYNEIGQLMRKQIGSLADLEQYLQDISYTYNERGWMTGKLADKLSINLKYNIVDAGVTPQYNGNIAQMSYISEKAGSKAFRYAYDNLDRMTGAISTGNLLDESLVYDKNGNILSLIRAGYGTNNYTVPATANSLNQIAGFLNGSYTYDVDGRLKTDGAKGLIVSFNEIDKVSQVTGPLIATYAYDANGQKLRSTNSLSGGSSVDYDDEITYRNGQVYTVDNDEGRALAVSGAGFVYQYDLTDHQNNVRVTVDKAATTQQVRVIQEDEFYPFGLRKSVYDFSNGNKTLFQHQEIQEGLNWYQFKYRMHDAVTGRFISIDPLSEKYEANSPYAFSEDKVTSHIELEGLEAVSVQAGARVTPLFVSVSGSVGVVVDIKGNVMPFAQAAGGLGSGVGINAGVSVSVYPAANSYSDIMGWGVAGGVMAPSGQDASFNISMQTDNQGKLNDVRLGGTFGGAKWGASAGGAAYLEVGKTWPLLDKPVNLKDMTPTQLKNFGTTLNLSAGQVKNMLEQAKAALAKLVEAMADTQPDVPTKVKQSKRADKPKWSFPNKTSED